MQLVYKSTKQPVKVGDIVTNFRGETATVTGWQEPKHSASTGRIETDYGSFYPSVYDCEWQAVVNVQRK